MKTLLASALLGAALLASCSKDDAPSLQGSWKPLTAYAVSEGTQPLADTTQLGIDPRVRLLFKRQVVRVPRFESETDTTTYPAGFTQQGGVLYLNNDRTHPGALLELSETRLRVKLPMTEETPGSFRYHVITATR